MLILHAGFLEGRLMLWGEVPAAGEARPGKRPGRKPREPRPDPYPYGAGIEPLRKALSDAGLRFGSARRRADQVAVWIPTVGSGPVASSGLIAEPPASRGSESLRPWRVTTLPLTARDMVVLLCACAGRETLAPAVVVGKDVAFWAAGLRLAGALVAREQFLPAVSGAAGTWRASWEPVLLGRDARRVAEMADAMPSVARAVAPLDGSSPPDTHPTSVLSGFLALAVDHLVRSSTADGRGTAGGRRRRTPPAFDSIHEHWLWALRSPDGALVGDEGELARFASQAREWQRPLSLSSPFRLCLHLEEPQDDGETPAGKDSRARREAARWRVRYLLQARDDPSLLVPAADVWKARGRKASLIDQGGASAKEHLLTALGQASGISPHIEASLRSPRPWGYPLDTTGAHEFLTEQAAVLEQAGFGVLLPAWWTRKGTKLRLTARATVESPKMRASAGMGLSKVVRFNWELALGDEKISLEELRELARLKTPLVRVRGQWVQVNAAEIQAALDFWKKRASDQASVHDVMRMAIGASEGPGSIPFAGVRATGWIGELLDKLGGKAAFEELPVPGGFSGVLRPYQVRGYSWLAFLGRWGLGACLADDMGLGKTVQALALVLSGWMHDGRRPALIICPTSVVGNWRKEAARFTPDLPVMVHHGVSRAKGRVFRKEARKHAIVLSSYSLLHRDLEILKGVRWSGVILDEAQNVKNPQTKQARAARTLPADYRVALTGTPVENHVGDLWSIMEFLNPGLLGGQDTFKKTFFIPIQASRDPEASSRLKRITGPFILRRLKTDRAIIADLPEKLEMKVFCNLTREQASLYAAVAGDAAKAIGGAEGIQRKGLVLATLMKLKQVCNHPAQFLGDNSQISGRSGKLARLTEMLGEIGEVGEKALVFSQFSEMGEILRRHLQETFGREVLFLHGEVPRKHRDRMVERFQSDHDGPWVFVLSLKAGGTGLNLMAANHVFHFDRWWNPAVESQATDRAFRIGQTRNVQVHKFLCLGTLEERIDEMIEKKREIAEAVTGTGEGWLTELSTAELRQLFSLRPEAVGD